MGAGSKAAGKAEEAKKIFEEALAEHEAKGNAENYCVIILGAEDESIGTTISTTGKISPLAIAYALTDIIWDLLRGVPEGDVCRKMIGAYMKHALARMGEAVALGAEMKGERKWN